MTEGSSTQATTPGGAVFLSYASEDAETAERIATAMRTAGIEVWFDRSELRGGDTWDHKIREQVRDCALFIPIISARTQARPEGYFRLEWDVADQRSHMIGRSKAFIVPVCVDKTADRGADVPDSFLKVQWTRLPEGEPSPVFIDRIRTLLTGAEISRQPQPNAGPDSPAATKEHSRKGIALIAAGLLVLLMGGWLLWRFMSHKAIEKAASPGTPITTTFNPPPHSIAVLPFVNMSGDKEQEYFSEGLTEELLNSLARLDELRVAARTSSFSFQGEHPDIATVAHKLNVASVLEGSVRRAGHTVRITTQLVDGVTGFHLWSQTYDRDLKDVLQLQTDIANSVANALKVTLLGDVAAKVELGGTRNPAAFDAYLRGRKAYLVAWDTKSYGAAVAAYTEAIAADPDYALAYANRSIALDDYGLNIATGSAVHESFEKAHTDALKAIQLAPDLAEGHLALANYFSDGALDFTKAKEAFERALALAPGSAQLLGDYGTFEVSIGHTEAGIAAARRAVALDPLNPVLHNYLGVTLYHARNYKDAITAYQDVLAIDPNYLSAYGLRGLAYYALGDFKRALESCESKPDYYSNQECLAVTYDKLGRHADAEKMLATLKASLGDAFAFDYACIYVQWGDTSKALESLDTAMRLHNPGLGWLKSTPLLDPVRNEPHFQAIEKALKFPN